MKMRQNDFNTRKIHPGKMERTTEATLFEAVCAMLVVLTWIIVGALCLKSGTELTSATRNNLIIKELTCTVLVALMLYYAYYPTRRVATHLMIKNFRQMQIASRMIRILAVVIALGELFYAIMTATGDVKTYFGFVLACIVALFVTLVVFNFLIYKAGK